MRSEAKTPQEYFKTLPDDRRPAMTKLRSTIKKNIPKGFEEAMGYGAPGWVVPHKLYPAGYHCDPKQALPFIGLASQKNYITFYHMGLYSDGDLLNGSKRNGRNIRANDSIWANAASVSRRRTTFRTN